MRRFIRKDGTRKSGGRERWTKIVDVREICRPSVNLKGHIQGHGRTRGEDSKATFELVKELKDAVVIFT